VLLLLLLELKRERVGVLEWVERVLMMLAVVVLLQWWGDLRQLMRSTTGTIHLDLLGMGLGLLVCELRVSKYLRQWLLLLLQVKLMLLRGEREWRTHRRQMWEL
jgi:hypothetical protein